MSRNWKIDFPRIDTFEICKQFCSTDYITMLLIVTSLLTFFELYFSLINKYIPSFLHTVIILTICEDESSKAICLNENAAPIIIIFLSALSKFKI